MSKYKQRFKFVYFLSKSRICKVNNKLNTFYLIMQRNLSGLLHVAIKVLKSFNLM